ncbi:acylphosphatase [Azoarcus sp. DD4]|uniref:acylphosphatase n=1 Tax=Azoarcus sp. DD4 TaxID=2027405 RepID=UPI00112BD7F7|nr:acylphosphatase [Azoarcus sp. DD4]QDF98607.1 acylphosphatase [Azoarcus sp. DD4]
MPDRNDIVVIARLLRIHGRVQGVSYRASAQTEAVRLGLSGWVRNRHDGSVEALVSGRVEAVEDFIGWAHIGPPAARVDRVIVDLADSGGDGLAGSFVCLPSC